MDPALQLKQDLTDLYNKSNEFDKLKSVIETLKGKLLQSLKERGMTRNKFDFGDKYIRYKKYNDSGQISQKLLKQVLTVHYPDLDAAEFMAHVLGSRTVKEREIVDIVKNKK